MPTSGWSFEDKTDAQPDSAPAIPKLAPIDLAKNFRLFKLVVALPHEHGANAILGKSSTTPPPFEDCFGNAQLISSHTGGTSIASVAGISWSVILGLSVNIDDGS